MLKKFIVPLISLALSVMCGVIYIVNGQTILADGTLEEAFAFLALSWLFFFIFIISTIVVAIIITIKRYKKHN